MIASCGNISPKEPKLMSQMITWGSLPIVYCQLCWSPILANHRAMKCELWGGTYYTFLKEMENLLFWGNTFVTCLVKPFHFHTRSGSELKGDPFALFIPSNIPCQLFSHSHPCIWIPGPIMMVGQSKTLIFLAPWRDYYYGWPIENTHFLNPVYLGHVYKPK